MGGGRRWVGVGGDCSVVGDGGGWCFGREKRGVRYRERERSEIYREGKLFYVESDEVRSK